MATTLPAPPETTLYERDFVLWTEEMAGLIESRQTSGLDWENLAEEIRDLGNSQKSAVTSHLRVLITHLIKWEIQPSHRGRSWEDTINNSRGHLEDLLDQTPSLRRHLNDNFARTWERGRKRALVETRMPSATRTPVWPIEQVLDDTFFPG